MFGWHLSAARTKQIHTRAKQLEATRGTVLYSKQSCVMELNLRLGLCYRISKLYRTSGYFSL